MYYLFKKKHHIHLAIIISLLLISINTWACIRGQCHKVLISNAHYGVLAVGAVALAKITAPVANLPVLVVAHAHLFVVVPA